MGIAANEMPPSYIRTDEFRERLCLTKAAVHRMIKKGYVTVFQPPGSDTLIPIGEVERIREVFTRQAQA
jgi:hypothetical protein